MVSYVLAMREKLSKMVELVQKNLGRVQQQQKAWYDRNARTRELAPGEEELVLLPTSANKLFARWQGPYKVVRKVGKVNYEVNMADKRKRKRILHINLLQKWYTPRDVSYLAEGDGDSGLDCGD